MNIGLVPQKRGCQTRGIFQILVAEWLGSLADKESTVVMLHTILVQQMRTLVAEKHYPLIQYISQCISRYHRYCSIFASQDWF